VSNTLGAARALLTRSYLGVQHALLSARDALRIAVREGDGALADQARARLRAAHREDLIAEVERESPPTAAPISAPLVRVEIYTEGIWRVDGEPASLPDAIEHFDRLCRALKFNGTWARENLDLHVAAVRIVDDDHCYALWTEQGMTVTGALFQGAAS
jgi:hypothetical protein